MKNERKYGYIAVTAALIIAAVLILVITTVSLASLFTRANISSSHFKQKSDALARSCVYLTLLNIAQTSTYAGPQTLAVGSDTCQVVAVVASGTTRVISAQGVYQNSYTDLQVVIPSSTVSILGWYEVPHF